ncbi:MAG: L,D-transpeptidase family protein [Pseudomonadota bacterium]
MNLEVFQEDGVWRARWGEQVWPCAIGRGGVRADKREGDGATPAGSWPLRKVFYRPDRAARPATALPCRALTPTDGWCDDPADPAYNRLVALPFAAGHEVMWREDHLYDIVVTLGHNDDPPVPGLGSAIFLHLARDDYGPTEGCVALMVSDLLTFLRQAAPQTFVHVKP